MGIFDTASSLIDLFSQGTPEDLTEISNRAGVNASQASSVLGVALPLILKAINNNTQTDEGLASFDNALTQHAQDANFESVAEYAQKADVEDGDKMLGHLFSDKAGITEKIADTLGLTPDAVRRVLVLVAPLLIKYLADSKKTKQLSAEDIRRQAQIEQETVQQQYQQPETSNGGILGDILSGLTEQLTGTQNAQTANAPGKNILESVLGSLF